MAKKKTTKKKASKSRNKTAKKSSKKTARKKAKSKSLTKKVQKKKPSEPTKKIFKKQKTPTSKQHKKTKTKQKKSGAQHGKDHECRFKPILNQYIPKPYKVLEFFRETSDTFTLTIDMKVKHDPGQFFQVSVPGVGESPISICSDSDQFIKLNIRQVGNVTNALAKLRKGDTILIRGPYGRGYPMAKLYGNNLLIIGGGCGVAPLKGIIDYVENHREDYKEVKLYLGYRSPKDIIFKRELEEWKNKYHLNVTVDKDLKPGSCYNYNIKEGFITKALEEAHIDNHNKVAFVCGPPVMMKYVIGILKNKGFNDDQIFISAERLMFCGIGVCCHCMIRDKYTCVDGPVFRYDEIKGYEND